MGRPRAFTLVELVIVILILGILAAIVVPKVINNVADATDSGLRQTLSVMRDGIESYKAQHNGLLPGAVTDGTNAAGNAKCFRWQLIYYSRADGQISMTDRVGYPLGPYLRKHAKAPLGPLKGKINLNMVAAGVPLSADASPTAAWKYDYSTGEIIFNYTEVSSDGVTKYEDF